MMSCEAGARASIRPSEAPSSLGKRAGILPVRGSKLALVVGRNLAVVRNQPFLQKNCRFSPTTNCCSALSWFVDDRATPKDQIQRYACACCGTLLLILIIDFPRQYHLPIYSMACHTLPKDSTHGRSGDSDLVKAFRHNQASTACPPIGCVGRTTSWCQLHPPDDPRPETRKPGFGGRGYDRRRIPSTTPTSMGLERSATFQYRCLDYYTPPVDLNAFYTDIQQKTRLLHSK